MRQFAATGSANVQIPHPTFDLRVGRALEQHYSPNTSATAAFAAEESTIRGR